MHHYLPQLILHSTSTNMPQTRASKIRHIWSVLCQKSSIDVDSNNVSLFNVVEEVQVNFQGTLNKTPDKPITLPLAFELVTLWEYLGPNKNSINVDVEVQIADPFGRQVSHNISSITIPSDKSRVRQVTKFTALPVTVSGRYTVSLKAKLSTDNMMSVVAEIPVQVLLRTP